MRTLQLARRFVKEDWGGTESVIYETSTRLIARGHPTEVYCTMATARHPEEDIGTLHVRRYPYFYPYFKLPEEAQRVLDKKGGSPFSFQLLRAVQQYPELDLIHLHVANRIGAIGRYAARKRRIPFVLSLHGGMFDVPAEEADSWTASSRGAFEWGKVLGWWYGSRKILSEAGAILCVGYPESVETQKRFPDQRVLYLPNGADTRRFSAGNGAAFRDKHGIPGDAHVLVTVARIDSQKNQLLPARLLPQLLEAEPAAHLLLVGNVTNPAYHKNLVDTVEELGLGDRVTVVCGLPSDSQDLVDAYHAGDVFLLPSIHEPFGIVILEAWAAGLPVMASRIGGIPHFVEDGTDGVLFDPADEASFLAAYRALTDDPALAKRIAHAGQEKARASYDWDAITGKLLKIYEEVIDANTVHQ